MTSRLRMLVVFTGLLTDGDDTFDDVVFGGLVQLGSTRGCVDVTKPAGIPTVAMCHGLRWDFGGHSWKSKIIQVDRYQMILRCPARFCLIFFQIFSISLDEIVFLILSVTQVVFCMLAALMIATATWSNFLICVVWEHGYIFVYGIPCGNICWQTS